MRELVDKVKSESFLSDYKVTDAEALGILISRFFEWDGTRIMQAAAYALEDANYHKESAVIMKMATEDDD